MTISHLHAGGSQRLTEIPGHKTGPIIDRAGKIGIKMNGLQGPGTGGIISENQGVPSGEVQPVVRDAFLGAEAQKEFEIGFLVLHTVSPGQQGPAELEFGTANRFEQLLQNLQSRQVLEQPGALDQPQTIQTGTEHHTVAVELFVAVFFGDFPDNATEIAVEPARSGQPGKTRKPQHLPKRDGRAPRGQRLDRERIAAAQPLVAGQPDGQKGIRLQRCKQLQR